MWGYSFGYQAECGVLPVDAYGGVFSLPSASRPLADGTWEGSGYLLTAQENLTGIACDNADVDVAPTGAPGGPLMDPWYLGVEVQVITDAGGDLTDFLADFDGNGTLDPTPAVVNFTVYDDLVNELCTVSYNADGGLLTDPASLTSSSGGALYSAWTFDFQNGRSDCTGIDPNIFGTTDVRDIIEAQPVSVAFGEMVDLEYTLSTNVTYWDDYAPLSFSVYVSFDQIAADEVTWGLAGMVEDCTTVTLLDDASRIAAGWPSYAEGIPVFLYRLQ